MYMGDFGGRSCRVGSGKLGNMDEECGEPGERLLGVPTPDSTGEKCWFPWELGGVVYADDAGKLVAILDRYTVSDHYSEATGVFRSLSMRCRSRARTMGARLLREIDG